MSAPLVGDERHAGVGADDGVVGAVVEVVGVVGSAGASVAGGTVPATTSGWSSPDPQAGITAVAAAMKRRVRVRRARRVWKANMFLVLSWVVCVDDASEHQGA